MLQSKICAVEIVLCFKLGFKDFLGIVETSVQKLQYLTFLNKTWSVLWI